MLPEPEYKQSLVQIQLAAESSVVAVAMSAGSPWRHKQQ